MAKLGGTPGSWRVSHDKIPPELAARIFVTTLELAKRDPTPVRVARTLSALYGLSVSPGTVRHWIVGDRKFQIQRRSIFKVEPSPSLSYVIGANLGDGCTLTENWIVKLEVADEDFAQAFNTSMATLFSRTNPNKILIKRFKVKRLPLFVVRYASKQLVKLLRLPLRELLNIAAAFPRDFLRGFFDAEGHVDVGVSKTFHLAVGVENTNRQLLTKVRRLLAELKIKSRIEGKRKAGALMTIRGESFVKRRTSYSLVVGRFVDVKSFASQIGFCIHRKTLKLRDALSIIETFEPDARPTAWKKLYTKIAGEWVRRRAHQTLAFKEY